MKLFNKNKLPSSEAIRYAEKQTKIYKQQVIKATNDYIQLQSNWNSLREYLIQLQKLKGINQQGFSWGVAQEVLDKMTELEGKDKE